MPSRSREFREQQELQAAWDRLRAEPWSPLETRRTLDSGRPRIQLVRLASFSAPTFWEICEYGSEWKLYTSTVVDPDWTKLTVRGYEPIKFDGRKLKTYFKRLTALTLPIAPELRSLGGLDGTITQLALFGELSSQVRYQWWSDHPPGWKPLVKIVDQMFKAFGGSEGAE